MLNITLKSTFQDSTGFNWDYYEDDVVPGTYYILPRPGFVSDASGRPSFQIVTYQTDGSDNGSGYCRMDVQLTVPAAIQQAIGAQIQQRSGSTPVFTTLDLNPGGSATLLFTSGGNSLPFTVPASSFGSDVASFVLQLDKAQLDTLEAAFTASGGAYEVVYHLSVPARLPGVTAVLSFDSSIAFQYQVTEPTFNSWGDETSPGSVQELLQESASSKTTITWGMADPPASLQQDVANWANATLADLVQAEVQKVIQLQGMQSGSSFSINEVSSFTATYAENQVIAWVLSPSATLPTFPDMGLQIAPSESTVNQQQQVMTVSAHLPFSGGSSALGSSITAGGNTVLVDSVTVTVSYPTLSQADSSHTFSANGSFTFAAQYDAGHGPAWDLSYVATYHGNTAPPVTGEVTGVDNGAYTLQLPDVGLLTVTFDATQAFATQGAKPTEVDVTVTFPNSDGHGNPFSESVKLTSAAPAGSITSIMAVPVNAGYNWQAVHVFSGSTSVTGPLNQGATGSSQTIPPPNGMHETSLIILVPAKSKHPVLEADVSMWYEGTPQAIPGAPASLPSKASPAVFSLIPGSSPMTHEVFTGLVNGDQPLVYSATFTSASGQVVIEDQLIENTIPSIMLSPTQRYFTLLVTPAAIDWASAKFTSVTVLVTVSIAGTAGEERALAWNQGETAPRYLTYSYQVGQAVSYLWEAEYTVPGVGALSTTPATATDIILNIPAQPPTDAVTVQFQAVTPASSSVVSV